MAKAAHIDGVYTLKRSLGRGGMATVMLAEVDLDKFDYRALFAYTQVQGETHTERRKKAEELAATLKDKALDPATMRTILQAQNIPTPGELVAVKIATHNVDADRFAGEWKNLLCLSHPNVVEVYGGGVFKGQPYYAMEYLRDIVPPKEISRDLSLADKLEILLQAARGLLCLHDNGIVHRDIKPGNMVTCRKEGSEYVTKITDLGLAKNLEENLGLTKTDMIVGSPAYMSPEQIEAASEVDHRADIYSLGATMYEFVTGVRPYHDRPGPYEVIIAVSTNIPPAPLRDVVPELPLPVCAIIQTAMEPDRRDRYSSVEDMAEDIATYLRDESPDYLKALSFREADGAKSRAAIGNGRYNFEEMLKRKPQEESAADASESLPRDLDAYRLLVMNRKQAQHSLFNRCARELGLEYLTALTPREADERLSNEQVDVAVFEYARNDRPVLRLCDAARRRKVPFLLHGNALNRTDILLAARVGAAAVMLNPVKEGAFREKLLSLLKASAPQVPQVKKGITTIHFHGKNSPPERARVVIKNAHNLLVLPHAAAKVTALCNNPNASADELAQPIRSDSAIAAMVLRRSNSAALGGARKITTIRDAVVRIGRREVRQLAITMAVYKLFDKEEKSFGFNRYMYWIHALGAGIAAKILARNVRKMEPEDAFLAGLLHDLGKIVLDDHLNADYHKVIQRAGTEGVRVCRAEQEVFMMDHAFVGARIGENWNLPRDITEAIEGHHKIERRVDDEAPVQLTLARLASMGNSIVKAMGAGHSGDFYVDDLPAREWQAVLGRVEAIPNYCVEVARELTEFADMLGISTADSGLGVKTRKKDQGVAIVPDGLGVLLRFFFAARGYDTKFIDWRDLSRVKEDVAFDARHMPDDVAGLFQQPESFWGQHVFMLCDSPFDTLVAGVHMICPAHDFFRLEQVLQEISQNAEKTSGGRG